MLCYSSNIYLSKPLPTYNPFKNNWNKSQCAWQGIDGVSRVLKLLIRAFNKSDQSSEVRYKQVRLGSGKKLAWLNLHKWSSNRRHLKGKCLLKAYKAHNLGIPWQYKTLNTNIIWVKSMLSTKSFNSPIRWLVCNPNGHVS